MAIDMRMGVLFQHGALFSALNAWRTFRCRCVNISTFRPNSWMSWRLKLDLVGIAPGYGGKISLRTFRRHDQARAALARALALDPDIVFLDEPTSGLDPIGAAEFDDLIANLRDTMGLTVYMVTRDLDSLFAIHDRIAVLGNKKVLVSGTIEDMLKVDDPWVRGLFSGQACASD